MMAEQTYDPREDKRWLPGQAMRRAVMIALFEGAEFVAAGEPVRTGGKSRVLVKRAPDAGSPALDAEAVDGRLLLIPVEMHEAILTYLRSLP